MQPGNVRLTGPAEPALLVPRGHLPESVAMNSFRPLSFALAGILACASLAAHAAPATPEEVVRAYADAANRHDVDALLALYAPDVRKYAFPATLASQGRESNREKYRKNFAENPALKVQILGMTTVADKVVSHDLVTGLASGKTSEEIAVYQVDDGQITNIVYVERHLR
jgi:hypothetical protein